MEQEITSKYVCKYCGNYFEEKEGQEHEQSCFKKCDGMFVVPEGLA